MYSTRIYYQDTDAGGVVYFANYLKFFEKSWSQHLMSIGVSIPQWEEEDTYIIVRSVTLELLKKLRYGDMIEVNTAITDIKNTYFTLSHTVSKNRGVTTTGTTKMVCIDGRGRPKRIPEEFKERLLSHLENA